MPRLPDAAGLREGAASIVLPSPSPSPSPGSEQEPSDPYKKIAADFEETIRCGALKPDDQLPTIKEIAAGSW
jgi:hypothetical protein